MSDKLGQLPDGWSVAKIGEIVLPIETCDPSLHPEIPITYVDIGSIDNDSGMVVNPKLLLGKDAPSRARQIVMPGDVLFSTVRPYLRAIAQVPGNIENPVASTGFCVLRGGQGISQKYLFLYSRSEQLMQKVVPLQRGVSYPAIRAIDILNLPFPVAPENEQIRIVEKLEELLSDLDNGVAELKAAKTKLTQYRQSLLKSAVEGSLTQGWREANAHKITETGEQLLVRILKERRARWEQKKLEEFASKNQAPPKDWQKKYSEPVKPDTSDLPELPEGWVWASIDQLSWRKRYGSSSKTDDRSNGVPVLRMGNIQDGKIDYTNLKYLPVDHDEFPDLLLSDGDLLFNRTNSAELVGKTAIFRDIGTPCSYASYLISVTFCDSYQPDLAAYFINSVFGKAWLATVVNQTAGQANVNGTKLGELAMPVPPVKEQLEIINQMISEQDHVQSQLRNVELGIKQSEAQRKNILKDAFSGRLVEQNSDDEAASILLEKIEAERVFRAKQPKIKNPKKKASEKTNFIKTLLEVLQAKGDWMNAQDAFTACGVAVGTDVDRIEEVYAELRKLEKEERILEVRRVGKYDQLKLKEREE